MENNTIEQKLSHLFSTHFADNAVWENHPDETRLLADIVAIFRPNDYKNTVSIRPLISILKENQTYQKQFSAYIQHLFSDKRFVKLVTDVGIYSNASFFGELRNQFYNQFLPEPASHDTVRYVLNQVFYLKTDHVWVLRISDEEVYQLLELASIHLIKGSLDKKSFLFQLFLGLEILTLRICGKALEKEISKIVPEFNERDSPFLALHNELEGLRIKLSKENRLLRADDIDYKQAHVILTQCKEYIERVFKNAKKYGISLSVNKDVSRIRQQLIRIEELLPIIITNRENNYIENTIILFRKLILFNSQRKNLKRFLSDSGQLFAYEITSHTAKKGVKYISSNKQEYYKMLLKALGGGLIVGLMCISKLLISKLEASDFGYAFLYSANYALGFIILYLFGFTLATKQPAMTASTLVSYLEVGLKKDLKDKYRYQKFAQYFSQLFRTQFIAFAGNVLMAFPIALLGVFLIDYFIGYNIAEPKAASLFHDLNPWESLAIFHAAIAGVYLYISGLIAGKVSNRNKFYNIESRIKDLPFLKRAFGTDKTNQISEWFIHNSPGIMSNLWFGIFMGTTASIGVFIGLPLDIRHITFAAGNFGLAYYGQEMHITTYQVLMSSLGIIIIGFMNFIISFGLSVATAFKAKRVPLREINPLMYSIYKYFKLHPIAFILPTASNSSESIEEEIKKN